MQQRKKVGEALRGCYDKGYVDGLQCFAHWHEGAQHVGTTGTLMADALKNRERLWNYHVPMLPLTGEKGEPNVVRDLRYAAELELRVRQLTALVDKGFQVVEDFMPNIGNCVLQDYGRLNDFLMDAKTAIKRQEEDDRYEQQRFENGCG